MQSLQSLQNLQSLYLSNRNANIFPSLFSEAKNNKESIEKVPCIEFSDLKLKLRKYKIVGLSLEFLEMDYN